LSANPRILCIARILPRSARAGSVHGRNSLPAGGVSRFFLLLLATHCVKKHEQAQTGSGRSHENRHRLIYYGYARLFVVACGSHAVLGRLLPTRQPERTCMFPEYRDLISRLKNEDRHFERLFNEHNDLDEKITELEKHISPVGEAEVDVLKKKKLALKDEIYQILLKASAK
jgi:uncharacterized protein YdcH (DUF465 family)